MLAGGRERLGHDLQQFGQPDALQARRGQHRVEAALGDGLLQVLDQHLGIDGLPGQVPVHEGLVFAFLDDALDQRAAHLLDPVGLVRVGVALGAGAAAVVVEAPGQQADQPGHGPGTRGHRQVERRDGVAERVLAGPQGLVEVGPLVIQLGDDHGPGHPDAGALLPQHPGQPVHPVGGRHGEQCGVRGPQARPQVAGEVGVPWCVEEVDLDPGVHHRCQGQVHRALLPDFHLIEVANRGAVFHPAGPRDGARTRQKSLDQSCLA